MKCFFIHLALLLTGLIFERKHKHKKIFFNKLLFKILNFDKYLCTEELDAKIKGHKFTVTQVPNKISNSVRCLLLMTTFWSMVNIFTLNIYQLLVKIIITDRLNHEEVKTQILEG